MNVSTPITPDSKQPSPPPPVGEVVAEVVPAGEQLVETVWLMEDKRCLLKTLLERQGIFFPFDVTDAWQIDRVPFGGTLTFRSTGVTVWGGRTIFMIPDQGMSIFTFSGEGSANDRRGAVFSYNVEKRQCQINNSYVITRPGKTILMRRVSQ